MINSNTLVPVTLSVSTLSILIAGLYSVFSDINPMAIPESLYLEIAEKLVPYLLDWDYEKLSFEDWVKYNLFIYPTSIIDEETLNELKESTIYFERVNGNVLLSISMEMV